MFFVSENLTSQSVAPSLPWEFKPTETITTQIRKDKEERQRWYKTATTKHCFYTALEGVNASQRINRDNPPHAIHGFVADYDIELTQERIAEAVNKMKVKPAWIETSLGGHFRLVWVLSSPILVDSQDFCVFLLQRAQDWLKLGLLPELDKQAFETSTRLYCNGCQWVDTGFGAISASEAQAFFVESGLKFRFRAPDDEGIPLDVVEAELKKRFPTFNWPGPFELDSQGPSFWVPGSESPQSAIVKPGGMFTFAAHAVKPFYSWSDILGAEFTSEFRKAALAKATTDIWWDGKSYWWKQNGAYVPEEETKVMRWLKVACRLSNKPGKSGVSPIEEALTHICHNQRVSGAGPFIFRPPGLIIYDKERKLNTYRGVAIKPAAGKHPWVPNGTFRFLYAFFEAFYDPENQLDHFRAWWKRLYASALHCVPQPGPNIGLMGGVGIGKTFVNRRLVGESVGGYVDASDYLVSGAQFNSHLFQKGMWVLDDDSPSGSVQATNRVHMMFKKIAANQQFLCNAKFQNAVMLEWMGRIGITTNLDFLSARIFGPFDNGTLDKMSLFRCAKTSTFQFPADRRETDKIVTEELPCLLRSLEDWEPPPEIPRDNRYGYAAVQEKSLLDQTYQSSPTASFKELLIEFLMLFFREETKADYWEGTVSMLMRAVCLAQNNEVMLRSVRIEVVSRYLEQIQREQSIRCEVRKGLHNTRIWRFYRF